MNGWRRKALNGLIPVVSLLIFLAGLGIVNQLNASRIADTRQTQIDGCERGNDLRAVIFRNTRAAIDANLTRPDIVAVFRHNLEILTAPPEVDNRTGLVDCEAAVE